MKFDGVPLEVSLRDERSLLAHAFACHQVRLKTLARSSEFHREGRRLGTKRGRATPGSVQRLGAKNVDIEAPWIREFLMELRSYSRLSLWSLGIRLPPCDNSDVCHPRRPMGCRFVVAPRVAVVGLLHRPLLFQEN